jgi:hypothetical protein
MDLGFDDDLFAAKVCSDLFGFLRGGGGFAFGGSYSESVEKFARLVLVDVH